MNANHMVTQIVECIEGGYAKDKRLLTLLEKYHKSRTNRYACTSIRTFYIIIYMRILREMISFSYVLFYSYFFICPTFLNFSTLPSFSPYTLFYTLYSRCLIFVLYKKEAVTLQNSLVAKGYNVTAIHGDKSQHDRTSALEEFKSGR